MSASADKSIKPLSTNRKALRDYSVLEKYEAGIELRGTEVKSVRNGDIGLSGAFARFENGQLMLQNLNIPAYEHGNRFNHEPLRLRRLLLHRKELDKLFGSVEQKGHALVPLRMYLRGGFVKVELGVCRGKRQSDKRESMRRKTAEREAAREIARRGR